MAESRIAFLYKAASMLPNVHNNKTHEKLKSYYRMRCKEISKGYGLPQKQFSEQVICAHCCTDWSHDTKIEVQSVKLNKRQRKRIKTQSRKKNQTNKIDLLHSNEIKQTCNFCSHTTKTLALKPNKQKVIGQQQAVKESNSTPQKKKVKINNKNKETFGVYGKTKQVFSLNNKKNAFKKTVTEPKIIKNSKKKKDIYAGLCKKAVLKSAALKHQAQEQRNQNKDKLALFLKPSS